SFGTSWLALVPWLTLVEGDSEEPESDGVGVGRRGIWVVGPNMLVESSEKHNIRESHVATLGHTYHSVSDVIGKIEGFPNGETIEHISQACIWMIFVSSEAYGIFTKNDVPFLEYFFQFGVNHLEWIEDGFITFHCTIFGFGSCMKQGITNQGWFFVRRRVNVWMRVTISNDG
ncbi:hypothetical protein Tco_1140446, partial [Tanacetum coccineum]